MGEQGSWYRVIALVLTLQQQLRGFPQELALCQQEILAEVPVQLTSTLPPPVLPVGACLAHCCPYASSLAEAGFGVHRLLSPPDGLQRDCVVIC